MLLPFDILLSSYVYMSMYTAPIIYRATFRERIIIYSSLELAQEMELADKTVKELNVPTRDLLSTTRPTAAEQNPVNQAGDIATSRSLPTCYRWGKLGHYMYLILQTRRKQFATNTGHLQKSTWEQTKQNYKKTNKSCNR